MKRLLEAINRGILKGLNENNIELLTDLDGDNLDQLDSLQTKSMNNKIDYSIKQQLTDAIQTGKTSSGLKQHINDPNNFSKCKGLIKANDKDHLLELITIGQKLFGDDGNFNWINTSEISDMSHLFFKNRMFNGHIELWDTSNVTDMRRMFCYAYKFNQSIGSWDTSNVTDMAEMFYWAENFNQPIGDWDVSNVENMSFMFYCAVIFNQQLNNWVVRDGANIKHVFDDCPIKEEYKPKF